MRPGPAGGLCSTCTSGWSAESNLLDFDLFDIWKPLVSTSKVQIYILASSVLRTEEAAEMEAGTKDVCQRLNQKIKA